MSAQLNRDPSFGGGMQNTPKSIERSKGRGNSLVSMNKSQSIVRSTSAQTPSAGTGGASTTSRSSKLSQCCALMCPSQMSITVMILQIVQWLEITCQIFLSTLLSQNDLNAAFAWNLVLIILPRLIKIIRHLKNKFFVQAILSALFCDYVVTYIESRRNRQENEDIESNDKAARAAIIKTFENKEKEREKTIEVMFEQHLDSFKPKQNFFVKTPKSIVPNLNLQTKLSIPIFDFPTAPTQPNTATQQNFDTTTAVTITEASESDNATGRTEITIPKQKKQQQQQYQQQQNLLPPNQQQQLYPIQSSRAPPSQDQTISTFRSATNTALMSWKESKKIWQEKMKKMKEKPKTFAMFRKSLIPTTSLFSGLTDSKTEMYFFDRKVTLVGDRIFDGIFFTAPTLLISSAAMQLSIPDSPFYSAQIIFLILAMTLSISLYFLQNLQLSVYRQHQGFMWIKVVSFLKSFLVIACTVTSLSYLWGICFRSSKAFLIIEGILSGIIVFLSFVKFTEIYQQQILDDESRMGLFVRVGSILVGLLFAYLLVIASALIPADSKVLEDSVLEIKEYLKKYQPNIEELASLKSKLSILKSFLFLSHGIIVFRIGLLLLLNTMLLGDTNQLIQNQDFLDAQRYASYGVSGFAFLGIISLISSYKKFFESIDELFVKYAKDLKEVAVEIGQKLAYEQSILNRIMQEGSVLKAEVDRVENLITEAKNQLADFSAQEMKIQITIGTFGAQKSSLQADLNRLKEIAVLKNKTKETLIEVNIERKSLVPSEEKYNKEYTTQKQKVDSMKKQFDHFKAITLINV